MPGPEWTTDARKAMGEMFSPTEPSQGTPTAPAMKAVRFEPITCFSTHFAELGVRGDDVILHFFPRAGAKDEWYEGHYLPNCKNCGRSVPLNQQKCPQCGFYGRTYISGRFERKGSTSFPEGTREALLEIMDRFWGGDMAVKYTEELGSYAIQLQKARKPLSTFGLPHMASKICETFDDWLEANAPVSS